MAEHGADRLAWTLRVMRLVWPATPALTADLISGIAVTGSNLFC